MMRREKPVDKEKEPAYLILRFDGNKKLADEVYVQILKQFHGTLLQNTWVANHKHEGIFGTVKVLAKKEERNFELR